MKSQEKSWDNEYKTKNQVWRKTTKDIPKKIKNKIVLELGVGNGKTLYSILENKPQRVFATDFSANAIKLIQENFKQKNLQVIKSNIIKLPFKDEEFDFIFAFYTLNALNKKDRETAVKEIYRVLKNKGEVFFTDFSVSDLRNSKDKKIKEKNTIQKYNGIICHFFSEKEIENLFHKFSSVKIKTKTTFPYKHDKLIKREILSGVIKK